MSRKTNWRTLISLCVLLSVLLSACGQAATPTKPAESAKPAEPAKSAPAAGEVTVTWATLAGFYTDWAKSLADEFTKKTGVKVNIVEMDLPTMYEKEVLDMVGGTGVYDIVTWNVSWKGEWANNGFLLPLDDYIKKDAAEVQIQDVAPALLQVSGVWQGKTYGLPYYTFAPGIFYRCDLFENADEMAAFQKKYGYKLDIPTTYQQMADIAEFFRRKPGDSLKGQKLAKDFYGIGVMAGRFAHIFDEINSLAWTLGGDVIKDDGTPGVTDKAYLDAVHLYVDKLVPNAPPGSLSGGYDFVIGQLRSGLIAMTGPMYLDQWPNAVKTEQDVPGAEVCAAPSPGVGKTWAGAFTLGITKATKHPNEAWQFLKWLTGPEAQRKFAEGGGSTTRLSILGDKNFYGSRREQAGHFPVLLQVLNNAAKCWYTNWIYVPQVGKIYEESPAWLSAAASKEKTPEDAMKGFAGKITELCGGKACQVLNSGVTKPSASAPECSTFTFDRSAQLRKGK